MLLARSYQWHEGVPAQAAVPRKQEARRLRVRFHIIRNARIENVGKSQSCMVSKLRIIWKQTVEPGHCPSGSLVWCRRLRLTWQPRPVAPAVAEAPGGEEKLTPPVATATPPRQQQPRAAANMAANNQERAGLCRAIAQAVQVRGRERLMAVILGGE